MVSRTVSFSVSSTGGRLRGEGSYDASWNQKTYIIKGGLSLKLKKIHIHLCFMKLMKWCPCGVF